MNDKLYELICSAKINESLYESTNIIIQNSYEELYYTFINVCSYIGSFLSINDTFLWLDTLSDLNDFIKDDNIVITKVYILITKLCIICDINIQRPNVVTGNTNIKTLRTKIIDLFEVPDFKISEDGISKYIEIMPSPSSETYPLITQIITGYIYNIKKIQNMEIESLEINTITNKLRNSVDYIVRKKYLLENKIYPNDNDCIWFLWSLMLYIFDSQELKLLYDIFTYQYSKKHRTNRIGLLHGAFLLIVYNLKADISRKWNQREETIIKKIHDIGLQLFRDLKREIVTEYEEKPIEKRNNDGLDYIVNFVPTIDNTNTTRPIVNTQFEEKKIVKCKDMKLY